MMRILLLQPVSGWCSCAPQPVQGQLCSRMWERWELKPTQLTFDNTVDGYVPDPRAAILRFCSVESRMLLSVVLHDVSVAMP